MKKTLIHSLFAGLILLGFSCQKEDTGSDTDPINDNPVTDRYVAFTLANAGQAYGKDLVVDGQDNIYYTSLYQGSLEGKSLSAVGVVDNYFAKHDAFGSLQWERSFGASGSITVAHGIAVDASENVYLSGYFGNETDPEGLSLDFGNGVSINSQSGYDAFLVKYGTSGNVSWALSLGNTQSLSEERAWDMTVDAAGNVYISGAFSGAVDFNPLGTAQVHEVTGIGHFIAKYDTDGQNLWTRTIEANIENLFAEGYTTLDVNDSGEVIVAGVFRGQVSLDGTSLRSQGQTDIFLASLSGNDGQVHWLNSFGGTGSDIVSPGAMRLNGLGEPHLTGRFSGTSNLGGTMMTAGSAGNSFLLACDALGNAKWAVHHDSNFGLDGGHRVAFNSNNEVYIAGWFRGTTSFGQGADQQVSSQGTDNAADVYLAKYGTNGVLQWAIGMGAPVSGGENLSICAGLDVDSQGNAIITGKFYGSEADFDPNGGVDLRFNSAGMDNCFVAKYNADGALFTY